MSERILNVTPEEFQDMKTAALESTDPVSGKFHEEQFIGLVKRFMPDLPDYGEHRVVVRYGSWPEGMPRVQVVPQ